MDKGIHSGWDARGSPEAEKADDDACSSLAKSGRPRRHSACDYKVITDLPDLLPITEAELDLLETELADFIAELMKK